MFTTRFLALIALLMGAAACDRNTDAGRPYENTPRTGYPPRQEPANSNDRANADPSKPPQPKPEK